jgi:hypothetical protein
MIKGDSFGFETKDEVQAIERARSADLSGDDDVSLFIG